MRFTAIIDFAIQRDFLQRLGHEINCAVLLDADHQAKFGGFLIHLTLTMLAHGLTAGFRKNHLAIMPGRLRIWMRRYALTLTMLMHGGYFTPSTINLIN